MAINLTDIDTFRTLCLGGRRTVVTYHGLNALFADGPEVDESTETEAFRLNELHGLPVVFLVCFAETSNLAVDAAGLGREEVLGRAGRIERAILGWKPSSPQGPLKDSVAYINNLATQEMVSQVILSCYAPQRFKADPLVHLFLVAPRTCPSAPSTSAARVHISCRC